MVDGDLQLLVVIREIDHLVDGILEVVDEGVIVSDDVAVRCDRLCNQGLANAQIFNHEAQRRVHLVVLLELSVHRLGLTSQVGDFEFFRRDILPQVPDLLVEHEFELFELLRLLLQVQNVLFSLVNDLVFNVNLSLLFLPFQVQFLNVLPLLLQLQLFVVDPSSQCLEL